MTNMNTINGISLEVAAQKAPAILAEKPADYITDRYVFTPTTEIISHMSDMGFILTEAKQAATKSEVRKNFGTHIVQFQHPDLYLKNASGDIEARPQVVIVNSHDGVRPLNFEMGIFRLVCSNGMIVKSQDLGSFKQRHTRITFQEVKELISGKMDMLGGTVNAINGWSQREMSPIERRQFAIDAMLLRINSDRQPEAYELESFMMARRSADANNDLWTVFNRAQESLIRGGFEFGNRVARPITNAIQDLELNKGLWTIAEQYA